MKVFEILRKKLMLLDISPQESHRFNWKIQMSFLMLGYSILSNIVFILFTANVTLMDHVKVFCIISELVKFGICSAVIVQRQMKLFGTIPRLIGVAIYWVGNFVLAAVVEVECHSSGSNLQCE